MTSDNLPENPPSADPTLEPAAAAVRRPDAEPEGDESFAELFSAYERSHARPANADSRQLQGVIVSLDAERVFLDIGYKIEGVLARTAFGKRAEELKAGDAFPVSIKGRNEEGYYDLSLAKIATPRDWTALEKAFAEKTPVVGTVTGVVKGGLTVDLGVRAFMPASRSGTRDAAEMEKLVGTEISCRITKLDSVEEDVVVDRRAIVEEQARALLEERREALNEGETVHGAVRTLMPYGAFIDLGGVDGLLHVSDISYARINKPEDVLTVGQEIDVRILKIDPETRKISLGLKQLQPEPWETVPEHIQEGQRVHGTVTRIADFGAFVEIEPGVEGLIHISEMAWDKKVRRPSDLVKIGDRVEAVVLGVKLAERRISLGLKQATGDPWREISAKYPAGSQVEGAVTKLMNFGAFVEVEEGVEGLVHISEIVADRRLNHPSEELHTGQRVKVQVLGVDPEKRQIKLSMKQLIPTGLDEYIAERKVGDKVSGRVVAVAASSATVELGEGIVAQCKWKASAGDSAPAPQTSASPAADLGALTSLLQARWKGSSPSPKAGPEPLAAGQLRSFQITKLDAEAKKIEVEVV